MNNPVSFELAKLIKEKGFDEEAIVNVYHPSDQTRAYPKEYIKEGDYILAPTIADVVMWLYEKHGIWIMVNNWIEHVLDDDDNILEKTHLFAWFITGEAEERTFNSPIEAYEAGIEYILTKLI